MQKELRKAKEVFDVDKGYKHFLSEIKERLQKAQIRAALAANSELVKFYWELGAELIEKQKTHQWGSHFLDQFSRDMRQAFPEMQGFSKRNLEYMRRFAMLYPKIEFAQQPVAQLPWSHIIRLMTMLETNAERDWYAVQTIKNGWSRAVLHMQIETKLYQRQAEADRKLTNFHERLPAPQSDLAHEMFKDPYHFDFLTIQGKAHERAIEEALVTHVRDFLLELGQGFAFVGSQVPLAFDDQEFFIDLLFYHLHLRAFVVVELKTTKFRPEHTGQLGFYLAVVDDLMRKEGDNQTIGILLCQSKNKVVVEYALRNMKAPMGVSDYTLAKALPKELKASLPTVEAIEAELNIKTR